MNKFKTTTNIIYNEVTKKEISIVHFSDIHLSSKIKLKMLSKLSSYVAKIKPDYIMITGDTIDLPDIVKDDVKVKELKAFLTDLTHIAKVLISIGNHDALSERDYPFFDNLNKIPGIYVLNNTTYQDKYIYAVGITLPGIYYYNQTRDESLDELIKSLDSIKAKLTKLPKDVTKLALIHSPVKLKEESAIERLKEFDLILCGHTHNGMVPEWLQFLFRGNRGIISPRNTLFPKIAKGNINLIIDNHPITIIISGGITKLSKESGKILSNLNFVYNKDVNKIVIRKKRGMKDE